MSALPAFPPIRLRDGTTLVASQTAESVHVALILDTVADLREAIENAWYVHGHTVVPELAAEAIDAFAVGVRHLEGMKNAAIRAASAGRPANVLLTGYVWAATYYAAEQLVDMMNGGKRITFGPKS